MFPRGTRVRLTGDVWHGYTHRRGETGRVTLAPEGCFTVLPSYWVRLDGGCLINAWPREVERIYTE